MSVDKLLGAAGAACTSVASVNANAILLLPNANRVGASIYNDSTANLYVKCGATASTTSYTVKMATLSYYELPYGYTGQVDGFWDAANGNARVTEFNFN